MKIQRRYEFIRFDSLYQKGIACLIICSFMSCQLFAQYAVRLNVYDQTRKSEIYIVGNFNNWNPGDSNYKLTVIDPTHQFITLRNINPGTYFFKFTRGNWGTVEGTEIGLNTDDRTMEIKKDTTLNLTIKGWIDDYLELSTFPDTTALQISRFKSFNYLEKDLDSCYRYAKITYDLSKKINNKEYEIDGLLSMAQALQRQGNTVKALELFLKALPLAGKLRDSFRLTFANKGIGEVFETQKDYLKAKYYYLNALKFASTADDRFIPMGHVLLSLGRIYFGEVKLDSAEYYAKECNSILGLNGALLLLGDINKKSGNNQLARIYYLDALTKGISANNPLDIADAHLRLAREYKDNNLSDSGFYYARNAFNLAKQVKNPIKIVEAGSMLTKLFENIGKLDSAFIYQQIVMKINDSLFSREKESQAHTLIFNEQMSQQEMEAEREKYKASIWIYTLSGGFTLLLLIAGLLIRNNRHKQITNALLQKQKEHVEQTLTELKSTQSQLIQSEKMASLGQLTAGIAHEIQNPLNFVNNFSEVSNELIDEMKDEIKNGNYDEVNSIADDVKQNLEKINHHGRRADAIVKGMLQHSRSSSGVKEPTNINALADEYLRLSYHGLRAKDKLFNATMKTDFDENIGNIKIIPQDIGRVMLNLINNAFYAVNERKSSYTEASENKEYEPTVAVSTKKMGGKLEIRVKDNGKGIPQNVLDKIFQPFFTTKPTGEGTGLGLSLSYDIVKAQGGELKVETKEGEGAEFIIQLPL